MNVFRVFAWVAIVAVLVVLWSSIIRNRRNAWAHRTASGREYLRWDRPRFRWLVFPDMGRREHFDGAGWKYRRRFLFSIWVLAAMILIIGLLAPLL
ncbi:MAG: hypothetical protein P8099_19295 [Gemmatimonadota bacterium]|jgi:hypothetical protein